MLASARAYERATALADVLKRHNPLTQSDASPEMRQPATANDASASAASDVISVSTTRAELESLEADWNALFERAARDIHVFQSFN